MSSLPAYKPTSLDLISRPNPVEPQSIPQRHPLNGTPQLPQASNKELERLLYNANGTVIDENPDKRSKRDDGKSIHLPKLPSRQTTKRLRIPPTLSGLHQPPPNSGLLPSISTEQPEAQRKSPDRIPDEATTQISIVKATLQPIAVADSAPAVGKPRKPKRKKWSDEETACLLKGVARFGVGNWTKISQHPEYGFQSRSALDLKDRFRVCCPDDYPRLKKKRLNRHEPNSTATRGTRSGRTDRKSGAELQDLGINKPFAKVQRRCRRGYSATEDEALLAGFNKHGNQWAAIRSDEDLDFEHRTATDLRDRMRTRYPELYSKAGLAPRPEIFPKPAKRGNDEEPQTDDDNDVYEATQAVTTLAQPPAPLPPKATEQARPSQSFLLPDDDVFFGAAFEDHDGDAVGITLDRGILDWPLDNPPNKPAGAIPESSRTTTATDTIATLHLPRPPMPPYANSGYSALPSLATITAFNDFDMAGQLELPSLMLGPLESDGRSGGHFLGFDELLS
ncbi:hypothetical protein LTR91_011441 [Friedmanniomyces endolithicus]|uniref:Myb-like domain-containing protein n=1 Tax=Friedmanniomyces endolithicus TaxID=329885 RepID=A0A4U0UH42_9PEZI|nr:hypothetical protein LTS09_009972 [Friedmanniomyces endolithicus]KAK0264091.1 hypothetical protein LTR35_017397 [Friedmanniomyces endolithicus]KAK0270594.1 hypothetical protein LTS00_016919 [Friedmanniomyces endolithicus]KAK0303723.1 hypothetical protein LTR01_007809 [Friedmanniomyces endolithicus]KAK0829514.1 hypothetical protein LTR73_004458 [Friedmanniomyces endolithicus]